MCVQVHSCAGVERLRKEGRDLVCRFFGVLATGHRCGEAVGMRRLARVLRLIRTGLLIGMMKRNLLQTRLRVDQRIS